MASFSDRGGTGDVEIGLAETGAFLDREQRRP